MAVDQSKAVTTGAVGVSVAALIPVVQYVSEHFFGAVLTVEVAGPLAGVVLSVGHGLYNVAMAKATAKA